MSDLRQWLEIIVEEASEDDAEHDQTLKATGFWGNNNFLVVVPDEFTPRLNWETETFRWCTLDDLPEPLHFGLKALLNDPASYEKIARFARRPR